MPPTPSRREFLCGCALCFSPSLLRAASAADAPPVGFREIARGVYLHTSWFRFPDGYFPSNGLAVVGKGEVLLLDTAWTKAQSEEMLERVATVATGAPLRLIVTHAHDDRMSGLEMVHAKGFTSPRMPTRSRARPSEAWEQFSVRGPGRR